MSTTTTYRERLLLAMKRANITSQSELARLVGVRPQSIQHLVDPKKNAQGSAHTAKIAEVLKVSPNWLASGEGSPNVILVDESHRSFAKVRELTEAFDMDVVFGFTASPIQTDDAKKSYLFDTSAFISFGKAVKRLAEYSAKYPDRERERLANDVAYMIKHGPSDSEADAIDAFLDAIYERMGIGHAHIEALDGDAQELIGGPERSYGQILEDEEIIEAYKTLSPVEKLRISNVVINHQEKPKWDSKTTTNRESRVTARTPEAAPTEIYPSRTKPQPPAKTKGRQ